MIKILCLHASTSLASYRYRVEQFTPFWKEYDIEVDLVSLSGKGYPDKLKLALSAGRYDYVWLQKKVLSPIFINIIASRSRLIYDFDDAIYSTGSHTSGHVKPSHAGSRQTVKRLHHVLEKSCLVFAGSPELVEYSRRHNASDVELVPTALEMPLWNPQPRDPLVPIRIGWIGVSSNMLYLELADQAAVQVQERYPDVVFSLMSGEPPTGLKTKWEFVPWSKESQEPWLRSLDIGIMPLTDDQWSRGKCAFKLLQYMSYGKPVIASAVGANLDAVRHGKSGYLVSTPEEWFRAFESLITYPELRCAMGEESFRLFSGEYDRKIIQAKIAGILHDRL
ncbi:MAG: glycosyltransferase family 4 protein [Chlorobiaceae bacterium]|nr:glycosyltransferase family 4 protein [Chlorobiaceae bacterium]